MNNKETTCLLAARKPEIERNLRTINEGIHKFEDLMKWKITSDLLLLPPNSCFLSQVSKPREMK